MIKYILIVMIISTNVLAQQKELKTVDYVDLKKYAGLWYEVAKIPNRFQSQCVKGTTAKYTLKENGEIEVINSCIDKDGELDKTEGVARVVDKNSNAKLEVSFFSIFGWRPIWGDYWIIGLDENYQWAIVGTPGRKYGWILARQPKLDNETLEKIYSILKEQGYNPQDFK
ncbi:Outer membrane lipoprotein Blc [Ignavibacterium album JCM 16511]|uniref:Outer membrane lipoprotein Blc n=1 Tax=Ignavibacterium album (strain DSM 19864 / JCM 16511 / NBRC 101810 / Mat9-16) TaxID=945713 RepID=I0AI92_IGNAJ|nr:lipocalin family protein [Ignavibacterium album]AFH48699.1 Outer membrane lipoprotein Blc [Ignavibacterium album JCM 16511]